MKRVVVFGPSIDVRTICQVARAQILLGELAEHLRRKRAALDLSNPAESNLNLGPYN